MPKINTDRAASRATNTALAEIANEFKALGRENIKDEKRTINRVVRMGELLRKAAEQCEPGDYMDWTAREFPEYSHQTLINYRNVYDLTESSPAISNSLKSDELNLSLGALYMAAAMKDEDQQEARNAIIKAAMEGRVDRSKAKQIIEMEQANLDAEMRELRESRLTSPAEPESDPVDEAPDEAKEVVCAECGKNAEEAKAAGHTLVNETECNGLGSAYGVWRCTACSQDEELKAERTAKKNAKVAKHNAPFQSRGLRRITEWGWWPYIIEDMGKDEFRAILASMQAALDEASPSAVKAAADRAESKSAGKPH